MEIETEPISEISTVEQLGNWKTPDAKLLVTPGFFNEQVGQISAKTKALADNLNFAVVLVHRDDALMAQKPNGIKEAVTDLATVDKALAEEFPNIPLFDLDVSLGGGMKIMCRKTTQIEAQARAWVSPIIDPGAYWDKTRPNLVRLKLLEENEGDATNRRYLDAIRDVTLQSQSDIAQLGILEERDKFKLGLSDKATGYFTRQPGGTLENGTMAHGNLVPNVQARISRFFKEQLLSEVA